MIYDDKKVLTVIKVEELGEDKVQGLIDLVNSGILKGDKGEDGKDGANGDDYVLTETDKQEIASIALSLLPYYDGSVVLE